MSVASSSSAGVPAVVLRTVNVGESDLLVILLTEHQGKISARARGARKSKRRFPGGLPVGARGSAVTRASQRPPHGLTLEGFGVAVPHHELGRDLELYAFVHYCCELADVLVSGTQGDAGVFAALCVALGELCGGEFPDSPSSGAPDLADPADPVGSGVAWSSSPPRSNATQRALALRRYELKLLAALGLLSPLYACCVCGEPLAPGPRVGVSPDRGGALCLEHERGARRIPSETLLLAERLLEGEPAPDDVRAEVRKDLRWLSFGLIVPHLGRPLRSLEFFRQLPKTPPAAANADPKT